MKEWKRAVSEKTFFRQDFIQGEIFAVDTYFYPEDITYYATEKGLHIEKENKVPQEYEQEKSKWNFYVVLHTRFQFPAYEKRKPIETTLEDIL
jgi:hypothetical protein